MLVAESIYGADAIYFCGRALGQRPAGNTLRVAFGLHRVFGFTLPELLLLFWRKFRFTM